MSDRELNHERDDELLSAYVDGELTETERAAVEARLASDPDAQHTLQQLRSVSQAVQGLPQEPLGRDLRAQILRRVEKLKPAARVAAADGASPPPGDTMPKFTIFQTRRSWVWASLVVAAGLLIMALQSGDERGKNLPAVASRDKDRLADETRERPLRRSLNEPAPAAVDPAQVAIADSSTPASIATAPEVPMAAAPLPAENKGELRDEPSDEAIRPGKIEPAGRPSPPPGNLADGRSVSGASPSSPAPMNRSVKLGENAGSKVATGTAVEAAPEDAAAPQSAGLGVAGGGARGALSRRLEWGDEQNPLVVVHVVAKQDAISNKAFDRLLVSNRIELEPEAQKEERAGGAADRFAKQAEVDRAAGRLGEKPAGGEQGVEFVLVEAPQQAIESCLAGLNKDSKNYSGVEVVEPTVGQDRADVKAILGKKVSTGLSRYSRGVVSQQQKDSFSNRYYSYTDADKDRAKLSFDVQGGSRETDKLKSKQEVEQLREQKKGLENLGRARRLQSSEMANSPAEKPASSDGAVRPQDTGEVKLRGAQPELKTPAGADASTVHVLFVLSPEREAASSAPAEKSAK